MDFCLLQLLVLYLLYGAGTCAFAHIGSGCPLHADPLGDLAHIPIACRADRQYNAPQPEIQFHFRNTFFV
jgi:hypothetical protein